MSIPAEHDLSPAAPAGGSLFANLSSAVGPPDALERLEILETLSYGVVYAGRIFRGSRSESVALLELDRVFEESPGLLARTLEELIRAAGVRDANVLSPRGVFRNPESLYVLFDAHEGASLATAFALLRVYGARLASGAVLELASGILAALDAAFRDSPESSHGLLTAENVFVGEAGRVFVRGFGLWAAAVGEAGLLRATERRYLSPAQNQGGAASPRGDLLSVGTLLFEALHGAPAFDAPAGEEDFVELRKSIEELRGRGEPSDAALYDVVSSCLSAPSSDAAAYRARLKTSVDTLLVRSRAGEPGSPGLSLEELAGSFKPRRPAIVRAVPLTMAAAIATTDRERGSAASASDAPESAAPPSVPAPSAPAAVPPAPAPTASTAATAPSFITAPARTRAVSPAVALVGAAAAILLLAWIVGLFAGRRPERAARAVVPTPVVPPVVPRVTLVPAAAASVEAAETPAAAEASSSSSSTSSSAQARATAPPSRPEAAAPGRSALLAHRARARPPGAASRSARPTPPPAPAIAAGGSAAPAPAAHSAPTAVKLGTRGLVPPVLTESSPAPSLASDETRHAGERRVLLELLVDQEGFVRGTRILRADAIPSGFARAVEEHVADLRFRPALLRGTPVRVWVPYELKFSAP